MIAKRLFVPALAAAGMAVPVAAQPTSFQHIIVVVQENRTPDNLFQGLCIVDGACSVTPQAGQYDIQTSGWLDKTALTGTTDPVPAPFGVGYSLAHSHVAFNGICDVNGSGACAMDGAALVHCTEVTQPCPAAPAFSYVDNSQGAVQPYIDLVHAYGWGNYMFQTNQGPSYPAHQFLFGATSAPSAADDAAGTFASENSSGGYVMATAGCAANPSSLVSLINAKGADFTKVYPCFERQTLTDLLDSQGASWRYYGVMPNGIWMAPNSIAHICGSNGTSCAGSEWTTNVDTAPAHVLADISARCALRNVSWVTPAGLNSDHMGNVNVTGGPSWVASIVNAVGTSKCTNRDGSSYWNTTAIVIVWDDWGGWYDHEVPTFEAYPQGGYQMGFRVPLIVVSASTPAGFISNTRQDFGSIIRFIEQNFGISEGALTFADARSTDDLTEFFNVAPGARRRFHAVRAPLSAKYFLNAKPSSVPPDDD